MNFCGYEPTDMINGEGVRCTLWVSGCSHKCPGCFNQKAWSYIYGQEFSSSQLDILIKDLGRSFVRGLSVLGGEPLDPENVENVADILRSVRKSFGQSKDIMLWTGYLFEDVSEDIKDLVDIIMDGRYERDLPTNKKFRGSDNQRMWAKVNGLWEEVT